MSNSPLFALTLALAPMSAACFDVEQVDIANPVTIDDFEDGDQMASPDSGFGDWTCWLSADAGGPEQVPTCELDTGFASRFAESMSFSVRALPNLGFWGVVLQTSAVGTVDLSSFRSFAFMAKFAPGDPAPVEGTRLSIVIGCPAVASTGAWASLRYYEQGGALDGVELTPDWSRNRLLFADFVQPWWEAGFDSSTACLENVHDIQFALEPVLLAGAAAAGTLLIDDVSLE